MRRSLALLLAVAACSRGDPEARARLLAPDAPRPPPPADPAHPEAGLALSGDELARRLGSFEWTGTLDWTAVRAGEDGQQVRMAEHHRVRQLATGELDVKTELDPGRGPGSESGKQVIYAGGQTYARALPAPFRARPTDRGRDARRYRDDSLRLAASLAALYGPALRFEPAGEASVLGRPARRFRLSLAPDAAPPPPAPAPPGAQAADPDTARRRAFLDGRLPLAADGELLADAATGAPLRVHLTGAFGVKGQPQVKASFELLAQVKALGAGVAAVVAPATALPDERKPAGPSSALEAAGLKKRGEEKAGAAEPADEPDAP